MSWREKKWKRIFAGTNLEDNYLVRELPEGQIGKRESELLSLFMAVLQVQDGNLCTDVSLSQKERRSKLKAGFEQEGSLRVRIEEAKRYLSKFAGGTAGMGWERKETVLVSSTTSPLSLSQSPLRFQIPSSNFKSKTYLLCSSPENYHNSRHTVRLWVRERARDR